MKTSGQIAIESDGAAEAGKIGEGGVSGEREDQQDGTDGDVVEPPSAHDRRGELREDALVAGAVGIASRRRCRTRQSEAMPASKNEEQGDDDGEGAAGVFGGRSRKAMTPLLTASTPVMAVQPLEKTRRSSQRLGGGDGGRKLGRRDDGRRMAMAGESRAQTPTPMTTSSVTTKRYVGIRKTTPVSRTPRMFTMVSSTRIRRQMRSVCGWREGTAEMSAPTPAEIPTAAVRT